MASTSKSLVWSLGETVMGGAGEVASCMSWVSIQGA
jgi:hypothetical protein